MSNQVSITESAPYKQLEKMNKELYVLINHLDEKGYQARKNAEVSIQNFIKISEYQNGIIKGFKKNDKDLGEAFDYMLGAREAKMKYLFETLKKYEVLDNHLISVRNYMEKSRGKGSNGLETKAATEYKKLEDEEVELSRKASNYSKKLSKASKDVGKFLANFNKQLAHYEKKVEKGEYNRKGSPHKLDHAVPIVMTAAFGGSVLYALSNLRPENFVSGAFTVSASSPIVIATTIAAIVFFLFFLTHHKLEPGPKTEYD